MRLTGNSVVLLIHYSKKIQHGDRTHRLCYPSWKIMCCVWSKLWSNSWPLLWYLLMHHCFHSITSKSPDLFNTPEKFRSRLKSLWGVYPGLENSSTHSIRKGNAIRLLMCQVLLATMKIISDRSSGTVFQYLLPDCEARLIVIRNTAAI